MDLSEKLAARLTQFFEAETCPSDEEIATTLLGEGFVGVTATFVTKQRIAAGHKKVGGRPKKFVDPTSLTLKIERTSKTKIEELAEHPAVIAKAHRGAFSKDGKALVSAGDVVEHMAGALHQRLFPEQYEEAS